VAGIAQAQFGKLKSLAKDKLKVQTKEEQKPEPVAKSTNSDPLSEDEGEAKATYAAGVQKSLDV
jgi:nitric oxide reductase large subunit